MKILGILEAWNLFGKNVGILELVQKREPVQESGLFSVGGSSTRREVVTDFPGYDHCDGKRDFGVGVTARNMDSFSGRVRGGKRNCGAGVNTRGRGGGIN